MRAIEFPDGWVTAPVWESAAWSLEGLVLFGFMLADGANLWLLVFDGGERFLRTGGETESMQETVKVGEPPEHQREAVERVWQHLLHEDRKAWAEVDSMMRRN